MKDERTKEKKLNTDREITNKFIDQVFCCTIAFKIKNCLISCQIVSGKKLMNKLRKNEILPYTKCGTGIKGVRFGNTEKQKKRLHVRRK